MFCIEIYNGYDVSYLSAKTERFIKSRKYAKRFSTYDEAKTELKITQKSCISFWVIKETKHKHKKRFNN